MRQRYIVAYDIRNDRRLREVHDLVLGYGHMLQYSVYICDLSDLEKVQLLARLAETIDNRNDRVAIVDLGPTQGRGKECFEFLGEQVGLPKINSARVI